MSATADQFERPLGYGKALSYAVILHGGLVAIMMITAGDFLLSQPQRPPSLSIEASLVDMSAIREAQAEAQRQAAAAVRREEQVVRRQQELADRQEREKQKQVEQPRAQRQRMIDIKAAQEQKDRDAALKLEQQQAEIEKLQQQRREKDVAIERAAQELRELAERRKAAEAAAEDQRRNDLMLAEANAASESAANLSLRDEYILTIAAVVTQNWLRPPSAREGLRCQVRVQQIPGGEVVNATIVGTCAGDDATKRSIIAAVMKVGYLPYSGFERVFDRSIVFNFVYNGD